MQEDHLKDIFYHTTPRLHLCYWNLVSWHLADILFLHLSSYYCSFIFPFFLIDFLSHLFSPVLDLQCTSPAECRWWISSAVTIFENKILTTCLSVGNFDLMRFEKELAEGPSEERLTQQKSWALWGLSCVLPPIQLRESGFSVSSQVTQQLQGWYSCVVSACSIVTGTVFSLEAKKELFSLEDPKATQIFFHFAASASHK